ncbi:protein transport protein SEC31 homolog B [Dendrobium catenatum]|uniref:WD-40 repeat-containing protein MSI2 n=1 Tax=Dendrobium catenatum TaxID=906689 RepID=A0A2I0WNE9_9ASPA|nr:protein transport protein SEC31 homolog B [Dendrobium catenatum]PKU77187.1 WD-40 repeat-containing protein MSI2 [Dendrobium catenatum]
MACIKSAPRSALAAFAPDAPYLAAGTMAGAVDLSFSSSANLEIFKLDFQSDSQELPVVGACPSSDRFNRLSWGKPKSVSGEYSLGLIAGGLGDGTISLWNPVKLIGSEGSDDAFVARLEKHTGPVRGLEFNPHEPKLLASGADEGELCIWDLENPTEPKLFPSLKNIGSGAQTEISFVSWNVKFQPILASTSYNGITVVWDLRQQKPVTSFSDSTRRRCSVLQWNPEVSTQLIIASDDDSSPALRVWDVRKTIYPVREFVGHTKGVIAMSWCPYESSLLLTCAKDNRTICWDTNTGEMQCELPASTNWNFDIHWYPKIPGVISASSFDVKLGIYNIEACNKLGLSAGDFVAPVRLRAPKWLKRPAGVSFGFGGNLVTFYPGQAASGASSCVSEVHVHNLVTEDSLVHRSAEFEAAIQGGERDSLRVLCEKKSQDSLSDDEKEIWAFLKVMFEEDGTARTKLLTHLGFRVPNVESQVTSDELGKELTNALNFDENMKKGSLFEGDVASFPIDNGDDFFNNLQSSDDKELIEENELHEEQAPKETEATSDDSDPATDEAIQRALVVGDYKEAVQLCLSANRLADSLVIAHVGGPALWEATRDKYLQNSLSPYLKIVAAMATNDLMALVSTRPLNSWKETLALLCTFAQKEEWTILCDTLGSRLLTVGNTLAATLCYICAGNIDKIVEIWSRSLLNEQDGRSYVDLLQDLMEKTIVLALASGQKRLNKSLSKLVENYAELLANQGLLSTAMEYLKLLGSEDSSHELAILQNRITFCMEEKGVAKSLPFEENLHQNDAIYNNVGSIADTVNGSQHYYQDNAQLQQQQQPTSSVQYADGYQQNLGSYGGYQPAQIAQSGQQYLGYTNPVQFQPTQSPQMFIPSQTHQVPQQSFGQSPAPAQPASKPFVPANPPALRNAEQYQQPPTLGSQLYLGVPNQNYQPGPSVPVPAIGSLQPGSVAGHRFPQPGTSPAPRAFMPVTSSNFGQNTGLSPIQPSSPTQQVQQSVVAPPAPPPTVQTVDTTNVPAELRPVIGTLTRLYNETSEALGGQRANPARKREIEDNSRKIGVLFAKLNSGDISPNASSKLRQLCQALDAGDFASALHIQVLLTTSDWDECNFWLAALKRMIKTRQNARM